MAMFYVTFWGSPFIFPGSNLPKLLIALKVSLQIIIRHKLVPAYFYAVLNYNFFWLGVPVTQLIY